MKPRGLLKTIVRTTIVTLGVVALPVVAILCCIGGLMLIARDPGLPPYSMYCHFDSKQRPADACISKVMAANNIPWKPRSAFRSEFVELTHGYLLTVFTSTIRELGESTMVMTQPVDFNEPVEEFIGKQRLLRGALRKISNELREQCTPDATPITCETRVEETTHSWN